MCSLGPRFKQIKSPWLSHKKGWNLGLLDGSQSESFDLINCKNMAKHNAEPPEDHCIEN